jgi:hypothetical protein
LSIENSDDYPNSIIQLNMRVLREQLEATNDYRIIETIFSNFNLFPQVNQTNETNDELLGVPISYQIANSTMIKADEDLVKFQIRVSKVRRFILKKNVLFIEFFYSLFNRGIYHVFIGHLMKIMVHG